MNTKSILLACLLGLCGLTDLMLVGLFGFTAITGNISKHPFAVSYFFFNLILFSASGVYALRMAICGEGFPLSKLVFILAAVSHVILGLLVQIGPGSLYRLGALIFIGTVYFLISFKVSKSPVPAA